MQQGLEGFRVTIKAEALNKLEGTIENNVIENGRDSTKYQIVIRETSLGKIQQGIFMESIVASSDGRRVAYAVKNDGKMFIVVDGKEGKRYDNLAIPMFSPNSQRIAYGATSGNKEIVVVDDQEGPPYDKIMAGGPLFSYDSQRVAYVAERGDKQIVVVDGQEGQVYDGIGEDSLQFSPDSQRMAYAVTHQNNKMFIVVDEREGQLYDGIGEKGLTFSPDSQRIAYTVFRDDKQLAVIDGQEGQFYDGIDGFMFSPDSQRFAYVGMHIGARDNKQVVVLDGKEEITYDAILKGSLLFSPDSKRLAYVAEHGDKKIVVVDGKEGQAYDEIGKNSLRFSTDSRRLTYVAIQGDKSFIVVDGQEGRSYDYEMIGEDALKFSPNSQRTVYIAGRGDDKFIVLDGREGKPYDEIFTSPFFSPDSLQVVYVAGEKGKQVVVINDQEKAFYDAIRKDSLVFSPDGQRVAYLALMGDKKILVIDDQEVTSYGNFITNAQFDSPTSFHILAFKGIEIVLIEGELVEMESGENASNAVVITPAPETFNGYHNVSKELTEQFIKTEYIALYIELKSTYFPEEAVDKLLNSKEFMRFFTEEAMRKIRLWGPEIANLSIEEMPDDKREVLEHFREKMREEVKQRLAKHSYKDIPPEFVFRFMLRESEFLIRALEERGFLKEEMEDVLIEFKLIEGNRIFQENNQYKAEGEKVLGRTILREKPALQDLLDIWGIEMVQLFPEEMPQDMRNALQKFRQNNLKEAEEMIDYEFFEAIGVLP